MSFNTLFGNVPSDWTASTIGDIATLQQGLQIAKELRINAPKDGYMPLLKITDLPSRIFAEFVTDIRPQHIASEEDIIYTRTGQVGLVYTGIKGCVHNNCFKVNVDYSKFNKKYIYYYLKSDKVYEYSNQVASGSVQKDLKHPAFKSCPIGYPKISEQKSIADTLSCLDDKIELNNRINKTLEEMAQAIFKSWFVDFKPFQDGEFEDSELGMIPKGWRVATIDECVVDMKNGGTPSRKKDNYWNSNDVPWIKTGEIKNSLIIKSEEYISYEGLKNSSAKILPYNSVLMAMYGATAGKIGLLKFEACTNQACCAMICNSANKSIFLYLHLLNNQSYIESLAVGAAQQNLSKDTISKLKLIVPDDEVIESAQFNEIFSCIEKNLKENQTLTEIRDTLLPKLMSGEIRVPLNEV